MVGDVRGLVVQRGDRGLHAVRAGRAAGQRGEDQADALVDHAAVPAGTVLLLEQHQLAVASVRASRRAWTSSISASRPVTSRSAGSSRRRIRASRMASSARSTRHAVPALAAYPSVKIE